MTTSQTVAVVGYLVLAVAAVAIEVLARRPESRLMPGTDYVAALTRHPAARWTVLALWWWVGWHFFVR